MKPDFLDDSPHEGLNQEQETPVEPQGKFCMLFLLKEENDINNVEKAIRALKRQPWIDDNQVFTNNNNNIVAIFFDDNVRNIKPELLYSTIKLLCKGTSMILYLANNQNDKLDVIQELRFYNNDFIDTRCNYKVMKLCAALHYGKVIDTENPMLYIKNINSSINIVEVPAIKYYLDNLAKKISLSYKGCNFIAYNYPILLKNEGEMPSFEDHWNIDRTGNEAYFPPKGTKVLGYYTREDEDGVEGPHIVLCPERIEAEARRWKEDSLAVYGFVLIHELAHALMDLYKMYSISIEFERECWEPKANRNWNDIGINWPKGREAIAMEESLANMILLQQVNNTKYFENAKTFIERQPLFYKFGWWQYTAGIDWTKWRNSSKGSTSKLQLWFDKCFAGGNILISEQHYSRKLFDEVFVK